MPKFRGPSGAVEPIAAVSSLSPSQFATSRGPGVSGTLLAGFRIGPFRGSGYDEDPYVYALGMYEGVTAATNHEIPLRVERTSKSWVRFKKLIIWTDIAVGTNCYPYVGICDGASNDDFLPLSSPVYAVVANEPLIWDLETPRFWTPPLNQVEFNSPTSLGAMVGGIVETDSNLRTSICFAFSAATTIASMYIEFEHAHKGSLGER